MSGIAVIAINNKKFCVRNKVFVIKIIISIRIYYVLYTGFY
jgi:hypothetical protein